MIAIALSLPPSAPGNEELSVAAGASLRDALEPLARAFEKREPGIRVVIQFAGSGALAQQIQNGGKVDVFFPAAASYLDELDRSGFVTKESRRDFLRNRLVLITGDAAPARLEQLESAEFRVIAIGDPASVPAGRYAKEALSALGLYEKLKPKFVLFADVRQVLAVVATGNADAGFVYASDAKSSDQVRVAVQIDEKLHAPIVYPVAILRNSKNPTAALRFVEFMAGPEGKAVFERHGFGFAEGAVVW